MLLVAQIDSEDRCRKRRLIASAIPHLPHGILRALDNKFLELPLAHALNNISRLTIKLITDFKKRLKTNSFNFSVS